MCATGFAAILSAPKSASGASGKSSDCRRTRRQTPPLMPAWNPTAAPTTQTESNQIKPLRQSHGVPPSSRELLNLQIMAAIDLSYRAHTNKVLGSFHGRLHHVIGGEGGTQTARWTWPRQTADHIGGKINGKRRFAARTVGWRAQRCGTHPPTRNEIMNALARWNQLNELADLQHRVGSLFCRSCAHRSERHLRAPQRIFVLPDVVPESQGSN